MAMDTVYHLPSGTEISVEAAVGDLERARNFIQDHGEEGLVSGLVADLNHVIELLMWTAFADHLAARLDAASTP